ncbi:30S ribosomal protein THX [Algoriphagus sp. NF]
MGKGDLKSKRGKINRGTFGGSRPKKEANRQARRLKWGLEKND